MRAVTTNLAASSRPRNRAGLGPGWLPARPGPLPARALLVAVNLAAVAFFLLSFSWPVLGFGPYGIDLDVYRIGGQVWLHGGDLYGSLPPTRSGVRLPFSYPCPRRFSSSRYGAPWTTVR